MPLSQTRWPLFAALLIGLVALSVFWYVVLDNPKGEAVPASGGQYTEGVLRAPERINPLFTAANQTDADLSALIFSGLVRLGPDGTPQPDLAERWEITANGQSYVFHLLRGVAWHDGEDFDAEDVVYTFNAIADPNFKGDPALAQLMQGVTVTARDPLTVEFKLEQTYAPFLAYLTVGILPKHLLRGLDANQLFNAPFNQQPVGTGPYRYARRTSNSIDLKANATYYLGPPKISTLSLEVFADDASLTAALRAQSIDGALLGAGVSRDDVDALAGDTQFAAHTLVAASYFTIEMDTRAPMFDDKDVRRALLQGINRQALIDAAAAGRGQPMTGVIPEQSWAFSPEEVPQFDPGAAASALERAGFSRDADGVRSKGDVRLSFSLATTNDPQRVAIAENVARQWKAIGVDAQVQPLSANSFVDEVLLPRKYQAALVVIDPGPDPDPYPFWHSSQIGAPGRNLANFADSRVDDALERARQTTDTARRKDLYSLFSGYLIQATPSIPLFSPAAVYVQRSRLRGFDERPLQTPSSRFANVNDWYVETRTRPS